MTGTRKTAAARPAARVPLTFAAVKERIKRPQRPVPLVLDTEAAAEIEALETLLGRAQEQDAVSGVAPLAPDVAKRLREVEDLAHDSVAEFQLQALSHTAYQKLQREHPPTADQLAEAATERPIFDPETFAPALVRAQLLSPQAPNAEEWQEFWDELSDGQMNQLWTTAIRIQVETVQLGARSVTALQVLQELGFPTN